MDKKILKYISMLLLLVVVSAGFASCSDDDDDNDGGKGAVTSWVHGKLMSATNSPSSRNIGSDIFSMMTAAAREQSGL